MSMSRVTDGDAGQDGGVAADHDALHVVSGEHLEATLGCQAARATGGKVVSSSVRRSAGT